MKILFLTDNFPPEVNAPATRTYEHCRQWARDGQEVTVITCAPNFPHGKVFAGYRNRGVQKEVIDGINVIRVWSFIAPNKGKIRRTLDFMSFAFMALMVGLFQKPDVIVGTSPQFFTAVAARWLGFFKGKPWVMEVRDLWPESIVAVGALRETSPIYHRLHKLEKKLYRSAQLIVVVTDTFKTKIQEFGIPEDKIVVIKNGVDTSLFKPQQKNGKILAELKLNGQFIIGYIGTHGMSHALDFILDCAKDIKEEVHFIFQGDGAEKKNLLKKAEAMRLDNITFLPFVSKSEIARYISVIDVALVNLKRNKTFKTVIPSKIFENAAMEKPILLGVEGESQKIIERYHAGVCFTPENKEAFFNALDDMRNADNYKRYQQGCAELAKDFERNHLAHEMLKEIQKLMSNKRATSLE